MSNAYDNLWKDIVVPRKLIYSDDSISPAHFQTRQGAKVTRSAFNVHNEQGEKLHGLLYSLTTSKQMNAFVPCLIYLHSHGGNCIEGSAMISDVCESFSFCLFDFSGYGKSEGNFSTLGLKEAKDLDAVIKYLIEQEKYENIFIWGRSMGAVTAIRHCALISRPDIKALVLDSPFTEVRAMVGDIMAEKGVPRFLTSIALIPLGSSMKGHTGVDVLENSPEDLAQQVKIPIMVMVGRKDKISLPSRVLGMFERFPHTFKQWVEFDGDHGSIRPADVLNRAMVFLRMVYSQLQATTQTQSLISKHGAIFFNHEDELDSKSKNISSLIEKNKAAKLKVRPPGVLAGHSSKSGLDQHARLIERRLLTQQMELPSGELTVKSQTTGGYSQNSKIQMSKGLRINRVDTDS